jgi:type I restriction enzyme, S subunit
LQYVSGKFWANNHTHVIQGTRVSTEYVYLMLREFPISGYITGAAQPKITQANLNRIPCVIPPASVAAGFDEIVKPLFRERQNLGSQIDNLKATRDLLLPGLVSGAIEVDGLEIALPEVAA